MKLIALALLFVSVQCQAQYVQGPTETALYLEKFTPYQELIIAELEKHWPTLAQRSVIPAQIEQETCSSAKSAKCWSPYAELKTSREYGFGWGQITVTEKFDNFIEAKKLDTSLKDWTWENRYNAEFQLRTLVLMDKMRYTSFSWAEVDRDRMAFTFASYNGGTGGVLSDRRVCDVTVGCNKNLWFNNVEHTSNKAKLPKAGYGQSFFMINRAYPKNILDMRSLKYKQAMGE